MSHYWSGSRAIHTALHAGLLIGLFIFGCLPSTLENPTSLYGNTLAPCLNSSLAVSQLTVLSTVAMAEEGSEASTSPIWSYRKPHAPCCDLAVVIRVEIKVVPMKQHQEDAEQLSPGVEQRVGVHGRGAVRGVSRTVGRYCEAPFPVLTRCTICGGGLTLLLFLSSCSFGFIPLLGWRTGSRIDKRSHISHRLRACTCWAVKFKLLFFR